VHGDGVGVGIAGRVGLVVLLIARCQFLYAFQRLLIVIFTDGPCITSHAEFQQFTARVVLENKLMLLMHIRNNPVNITNRYLLFIF